MEGIDQDKRYLKDSLQYLERRAKSGNKRERTTYAKTEDFTREAREGPLDKLRSQHGWDVFNDDAIFRAHSKRIKKLHRPD